jgi:DNA-binding response OmpR family regulator
MRYNKIPAQVLEKRSNQMHESKILIIDDSTELRSLLESILPYSGYRAISATSGQDGLDLAEELKPDLILLDLELPDTTGLEVLEALERQEFSIPTIMMTGYGSEGIASDALRLGALGYLVKPFTTEEVLSSIERALAVGHLQREKEQLMAKLDTYARQFQMIHAVGRAMITGLELDQFFQRIVEAGLYATRAETCALSVLDADSEKLRVVAASGKTIHSGHSFPSQAGDPRLWTALEEGTRLRLHASSGLPIILQTGQAVRALLQVPLVTPQGVAGLLSVDRQSTSIPFGKQDEQVLAILGDYVVISLDRHQPVERADADPARSAETLSQGPG